MNSLQRDFSQPYIDQVNLPQSFLPLECLSGTVFLYPLRAAWIEAPSEEDNGPDGIRMGDYPELFKDKGKFILCLQVWVTNSECNNWADHKWNKLNGRFPEYPPIDYFLDKKEGDTVEIICKEKAKKFSLTCQQRGSRYQENFRSFEDMMEEMFMVTYNTLNDRYQKGILTEEEQKQWEIISEIKKKNYPNSSVTNKGMGTNCKIQ